MMNHTLKTGIEHEFKFIVPESKTVPHLYPESPEFQQMPQVFATGFMVGLVEWTCIQALNPYIDWPDEQTVGTHVNLSHTSPTPPGMEITTRVRLIKIHKRLLVFDVEVHDEKDEICRGTHERYLINADKFNAKVTLKNR